MKQKLLEILIQLKETNSWDLAEEIARGIYGLENIEEHYIETIISFLKNSGDKIKNENTKRIINQSISKLEELKQEEFRERELEKRELVLDY